MSHPGQEQEIKPQACHNLRVLARSLNQSVLVARVLDRLLPPLKDRVLEDRFLDRLLPPLRLNRLRQQLLPYRLFHNRL